jgi:hypothetical protein
VEAPVAFASGQTSDKENADEMQRSEFMSWLSLFWFGVVG